MIASREVGADGRYHGSLSDREIAELVSQGECVVRAVRIEDVEWIAMENSHRNGGLEFKTILTGGGDGAARLWDAATGEPVGPPLRHESEVRAVAFSPDGKTVLTGCQDKAARLWDVSEELSGVRFDGITETPGDRPPPRPRQSAAASGAGSAP